MSSEDVGTIRLGLEANASNFQKDIQDILNRTEDSVRSKAARIAAIYRRQGMTQSSAMRKAWADVGGTTSKACDSMVKSSGTATNRISSAFSGLASKITTAFSLAAITAFTKKSIESAASVNALNSQFEQTFGNMQDQAEQALQTVAKNSGIVQSRLQGVGTSIYAFAKTTGMDSASAMTLMSDALQITADSAAYYDRSLEETAESLKSFLKGNFENDAALGLSCTETTRNTAANKLYGKSFIELSEAQKQLTLLQMVKDANQLSGAMGQASREADGWENITGNLKEAWKQFSAVIGQPALKIATNFINQLTTAIQKLTVYAESAIGALSKLFNFGIEGKAVSSVISDTTNSVSDLSSDTDVLSDNMSDTAKSAEKIKKSLAGFDQLNILSGDNTSNTDLTSSSTNNTPINTPEIETSNTEKSINHLIDNIQSSISSIDFHSIKDNFETIMKSIQPIAKSTLKGVQKIFSSSMEFIGSVAGGIISNTGKSIQTVSGGIAQWLNKDKEKISKYIDTISINISSGFNNLSSYIDKISTITGKSIDRMRPRMEKAISGMLSGITTFSGSLSYIISSAFNTATGVINQWSVNNEATIGTFFDNIQLSFSKSMEYISNIFTSTGNKMTEWWNNGGQELWEKFIGFVTDLGTIFMEVFNEWIKPAWDALVDVLQIAWDKYISPIFWAWADVVGKIGNALLELWNNILKPVVDWLISFLGPIFENTFNQIKSVCDTVFSAIGGYMSGLLDALSGLIDFITGIFSGDWEKAWNGIKSCFEGIWNAIWSVIKGIINLMIDGINGIWTGIYNFAKGAVDTIGGISGAIGKIFGQDWSFSLPDNVPTIPKLAKGGLVTAPTLALVGDNKNAHSDPEVVAPLSKLKGMISEEQQTGGNIEILTILKRIYNLLCTQETQYTNVIYLDSEEIERKMVKVRKRKSRRYGGVTT